jgi:hypothetical protein
MTPKEQIEIEKAKLMAELRQSVEQFESNTGLKVYEIPVTRYAKFVSDDHVRFYLNVIIKL